MTSDMSRINSSAFLSKQEFELIEWAYFRVMIASFPGLPHLQLLIASSMVLESDQISLPTDEVKIIGEIMMAKNHNTIIRLLP